MLRSRRLAFAAAALLIGLSACGDVNPSTTAGKTPAIIHVGADHATAVPGAGRADAAMMPYLGTITYVFDGQFPDLGATGASWSIRAGQKADLTRVAALAAALGVKGDVRALTADQGGGWAVGPNDGTATSLMVADDGLLTWWYNGTSGVTGVGCAVTEPSSSGAGSSGVNAAGTAAVSPPDQPVPVPDTAPVDKPAPVPAPVPCQPTPPPANVPDKAAALAKAKALLASVGENVADYEFTTNADQYSASVSGFLVLGGHRSQLQFNVGFGAEGAVIYASGFMAVPQPAADYPLVSGDVAVQRLNDPTGKWMFFGGPRPLGIAVDTVANGTNSATSTGGRTAPAVGAAEPAAAPEPLPPATIVCDAGTKCATLPGDTVAPPAPVTIHLDGVRLSLVDLWAQDGTVWLLPAYTFTTADGGEYTVVAVEESFIDIPKPDTDTTIVDGGTTPPASTVIPPTPDTAVPGTGFLDIPTLDPAVVAKELVGLSIAQAADVAKANGWTVRVSTIDGVSQILTADYSPTRANLSVKGGIVVGVDSIG